MARIKTDKNISRKDVIVTKAATLFREKGFKAASMRDLAEAVGVEESGSGREDLSNMSLEELQTLLNDVLEHEDYIRAIAIRDEMNKRK